MKPFTGKKCLVLCAGILKEEVLHQDPVAPANTRIQQILRYMDKNFNLFFVGSRYVEKKKMLCEYECSVSSICGTFMGPKNVPFIEYSTYPMRSIII